MLSLLNLEQEGDDGFGYRLRVGKIPGAREFPITYVILEDGEYRILGSTDTLEGVGKLVLELLEKGDVKGAQKWLDFVVPDLRSDNREGSAGPATRFLWSGMVEETRGPRDIRAAAASMIGRDSASEKAIQILKDARLTATAQIERNQIDLALCESLDKAKKWDELLTVARRLAGVPTFASDGFRFIVRAATGLKQWKTLQIEGERRLSVAKSDRFALRALATASIHQGNAEAAAKHLKTLAGLSYADSNDKLFEARNAMLIGVADNEMLTRLMGVAERTAKADYWYTLGLLQATLQKPEDAQRSLARALDMDDFAVLDAQPWVLVGKIYEQYGITDAAAAAYQRALGSSRGDDESDWAVLLITQANSTEAKKE
jgi:tetratricopeptide (TPR) repeat protein